ncbi:MAG: hypothetical protein Q8M16_08010, partial [Pirellulaceae bacterium]|nr:hypothetical protein [Pirellulaceae bacterium]
MALEHHQVDVVVIRLATNIAGQILTSINSFGRAANLSSTTMDSVNDVNTQSVTTYTYMPLQSQASYLDRNDARVTRGYDFRGRQETETHTPRSGMSRLTKNFYVDNQLFKMEESFDTFIQRRYFGRSANRLTIREIATRDQTVEFANNAAILAATRVTGSDPAHSITDAIRDGRGQIVQMIDPTGTIAASEFDAAGRNTKTTRGFGLAYKLESLTEYNGKGQVTKTTDPAGTHTVMTYDNAGNVLTRTIAHGTSSAATWSYTYTLDGRQATETMPNGGVNTSYYNSCCGQFAGSKNALGHGQISNVDPLGRSVHSATVADYSTHTNPMDPIDAKTLSETTTRYRDDGRIAATTTWKQALGAIDPLNPPIAGLNGVAATQGITTQYVYDNRLSDGSGLDSSAGTSINRLGGGTASVNIQAALTKLAATVPNGGAEVTFNATRSGKATVAISPDEKTMNVSIQDAMGRSVFQGLMSGPAATTPNQLLSWTSVGLDKTYTLAGVGLCEATWQIMQDGKYVQSVSNSLGQSVATLDQLAKLSRSKYNAAGNLLQQIDPLSNTTNFEYDLLGRQTKTIDPLNNQSETVYHATTGRVSSQKDAKSVSMTFTYNPLGQVLTSTDRAAKVTTNTYNNMGQVATVKDAENRTTAYGYNLLGARNSLTFSDTGVQTVNTFDGAGRPLEITS